MVIVSLPAKAKYPTDPLHAKVRAAYAQVLNNLASDFSSILRPSYFSATRVRFL